MIKHPNYNKHAVVSYSGGMDSTCLVLHLLSEGYKVRTYSFDYGQAHKIELKKAKNNIKYLKKLGFPVEHQVINVRDVFSGDTSTLVQHTQSPSGDYREETMKSTVVSNRNCIFSAIVFAKALSWAKQMNSPVVISLGVHGGDHCFTGDTKILTPSGLKTINELKIGDELFSLDPGTQKIHIDKCLDVIHKGTNNEIYNISTTSGDIRLTGEHQVYTCDFSDYDKSKGYIKSITKKMVKDLMVNDYMISSYKMPDNLHDEPVDTINIKDIFEKLDHHTTYVEGDKFGFIRDNGSKTNLYNINMPAKEFLNLMAWYISEGWTSKVKPGQSKYTSCFSQSMYKNLENNESIREELKILDIPLSVSESKIRENGRPKEVTYQFNSVISAIMQNCGHNSRKKYIPDWMKSILYKSKELRTSFIHTLCLGDGHYDEISNIWTYQSNSFQLIQDITELIKLNGLYVKLSKPNTRTLTRSISFGSKESKSGLVRLGDASITRVRAISKDTSKMENVYDISVEKNHNFFAGNLGNVLISNSIYPDCRPESVEMARELYRISNWDSELVDYSTPFVDISKADVLREGIEAMNNMGFTKAQRNKVLKNTISCYNATPDGTSCGTCGTCTERIEAFRMNSIKDPAKYSIDVDWTPLE